MNQVNLLVPGARRGNYRTLFERSQIPIALVSVRGGSRIVTASRGFLDTFDLRRAMVVGRALDQLFSRLVNVPPNRVLSPSIAIRFGSL